MPPYLKISRAAAQLGVSTHALRDWADSGAVHSIRTPGGQRLIDPDSITGFQAAQARPKDQRQVVLYSRVSSRKQQDDLDRQRKYLLQQHGVSDEHPRPLEVSDIGSGLNFKRPGLLRVLGLVQEGHVSKLVVASRDRLARFGFELIQWLCERSRTQLVVLDSQDCAEEAELGKDLMAIVQVYCCRWNGRRRYRQASTAVKAQDPEAGPETDSSTEVEAEPNGRLRQVHLQQSGGNDDQQPEHSEGCVSGP